MSEPIHTLKRGTLNRLASELHSGGRISADRVAEILNESRNRGPEPVSADNEDGLYRAYLEAIGETRTFEIENSDEIDPMEAEVMEAHARAVEAEDRAREAQRERDEAEADRLWPAYAAWQGMRP